MQPRTNSHRKLLFNKQQVLNKSNIYYSNVLT